MTHATITPAEVATLKSVEHTIGAANQAQGFHDRGILIRQSLASAERDGLAYGLDAKFWRDTLNDYLATRLLLIVSEVTEAHDELRNGRTPDETYYVVDGEELTPGEARQYEAEHGVRLKPEGFPSEVADVEIRTKDLSAEIRLGSPAMIREKVAYNATRPRMHGKKF